MEFRIDTNRLMRIIRGVCFIILLPSFIYLILLFISDESADTLRIMLSKIVFVIIMVVMIGLIIFFIQGSQKKKYMKCFVRVDDVGILIHDLTDTENYFTYEEIKYIYMGAKKSHALVISHNKKCSTILNFTKDYQDLIDILKKKNVIFVNKIDVSESVTYGQRYIQGLNPTNIKKVYILLALMGLIVLLLKVMQTTF